jgi:glycerol uptake facilitator-like aquaporin
VGAGINFVLFRRAIAAFESAHSLVRGAKGSAATYHGAFALFPDFASHGVLRLLLSEVTSTAILLYMVSAISECER